LNKIFGATFSRTGKNLGGSNTQQKPSKEGGSDTLNPFCVLPSGSEIESYAF
jgi:hypothetical protein